MCYIPTNLRMYRIMGRNRREPNLDSHVCPKRTVEIPARITTDAFPWEETDTEFVKKTPYGDIVIRKRPKRTNLKV